MRSLTWYLRRLAYKAYELIHLHEPWLAQGAVRFLESELPATGSAWSGEAGAAAHGSGNVSLV